MYVDIYVNLHKTRKHKMLIYSVKDKKRNKVSFHSCGGMFIEDARLVVSKAGRERVLKERKKNVHAFIRGNLVKKKLPSKEKTLTYNPYRFETFVDEITHKPVLSCNSVYIDIDGKIYYF